MGDHIVQLARDPRPLTARGVREQRVRERLAGRGPGPRQPARPGQDAESGRDGHRGGEEHGHPAVPRQRDGQERQDKPDGQVPPRRVREAAVTAAARPAGPAAPGPPGPPPGPARRAQAAGGAGQAKPPDRDQLRGHAGRRHLTEGRERHRVAEGDHESRHRRPVERERHRGGQREQAERQQVLQDGRLREATRYRGGRARGRSTGPGQRHGGHLAHRRDGEQPDAGRPRVPGAREARQPRPPHLRAVSHVRPIVAAAPRERVTPVREEPGSSPGGPRPRSVQRKRHQGRPLCSVTTPAAGRPYRDPPWKQPSKSPGCASGTARRPPSTA